VHDDCANIFIAAVYLAAPMSAAGEGTLQRNAPAGCRARRRQCECEHVRGGRTRGDWMSGSRMSRSETHRAMVRTHHSKSAPGVYRGPQAGSWLAATPRSIINHIQTRPRARGGVSGKRSREVTTTGYE